MGDSDSTKTDWQHHGLRIVRSSELDTNTPQTPGMTRAEAISHARVGAQKLWAGTVVVQPNAKTGPHHHGELGTVIYVVRGRARFRWGNRLEFVDEAGPGDFVYVPPYVPHHELNYAKTSRWRQSSCAAVRSLSSSIWTFPVRRTLRSLHETIRFTLRPESAEPCKVPMRRDGLWLGTPTLASYRSLAYSALASFRGSASFLGVGGHCGRPARRTKSLKRGSECRLSSSGSTLMKVISMERSANAFSSEARACSLSPSPI